MSSVRQKNHYAPHRPHVDRRVVVVLQRDQLRSAVPARYDVLRQLALERGLVSLPDHRVAACESGGGRGDLPGEAEIDDFDVAVAV